MTLEFTSPHRRLGSSLSLGMLTGVDHESPFAPPGGGEDPRRRRGGVELGLTVTGQQW